jgi:undecaprenyl-diphosphatase
VTRLFKHLITVDHDLRAWVVAHRVRALDGAMWALSRVGEGGLVWLLIGAGLAAADRPAWRDLARLALAVLVASLVTNKGLKPAFRRKRPSSGAGKAPCIGRLPSGASFPSAHTANAFAAAFVLLQTAPAGRVFWWLLAAAIAFSRVYLGVHYPLDVIGGASPWIRGAPHRGFVCDIV